MRNVHKTCLKTNVLESKKVVGDEETKLKLIGHILKNEFRKHSQILETKENLFCRSELRGGNSVTDRKDRSRINK